MHRKEIESTIKITQSRGVFKRWEYSEETIFYFDLLRRPSIQQQMTMEMKEKTELGVYSFPRYWKSLSVYILLLQVFLSSLLGTSNVTGMIGLRFSLSLSVFRVRQHFGLQNGSARV